MIRFLQLESSGRVVDLVHGDLRRGAEPEEVDRFMRGPEVGLYFGFSKGGQLVPSVWMDAVYPPPSRSVTRY